MDHFPLFARIAHQPCLVVGGGVVALRKARELLRAGARVTVNAPELHAGIRELARAGALRVEQRPFTASLVAESLLVIAATDDRDINAAVAAAASAQYRLCNVVDDGDASSFIFPAVVERSPVMVAISSGGHAPVLARLLRQRLEQWLPAGIGALARWAGQWRGRVRDALPAITARRAFWEDLLSGPAADAVLQGDSATADALAAGALAGEPPTAASGRAWLVGAGPGDPGLISVRGLRALQEADVVIHDRLVAPELLRAARREAELVNVGKRGGRLSTSQQVINELLVSRVRAGARVCRLKGGDPLVFGRGGEEALALAAAGLPFGIIPGITAASACGAAAGIPLTHRGLATAVTLVTASGASDGNGTDWRGLAALDSTLAIYMGGARIAEVAAELQRHGRRPGTPAAVIRDGTLPGQTVLTGTLGNIAARAATDSRPGAPALLLVGATVSLAARLAGPTQQIDRRAS